MYKKIILILLFSCLILPIVNLYGKILQSNGKTPTMVAEQGLHSFLNKIPKEQMNEYGFFKGESFDHVYLGNPFKLYQITPIALSSYKPGDSIDSIISETHLWYFPIMLNDENRAILVVDLMDNNWEVVSLGYANLARELGKVTQQWNTQKNYNPLLIAVFQANEYLFTVPEIDDQNLTSIVYIKQNIESTAKVIDYSITEKLYSIIERLKPIVEENIRGGH